MPQDIRKLHQEAARRRISGSDETPLLKSVVVVRWNAYRREFNIRLDDRDLGLEKVTSLRSKSLGRMELQVKTLTRQDLDPADLWRMAAAYGKAVRDDDGDAVLRVDYRDADPNGFNYELGRFPVDLAPRAVRRILDGGFSLERLGDAVDAEFAPRALAFGLTPMAERGGFESDLADQLAARDPEHNRQSSELTRALRDEIMAAPEFATNDQYRRAADMAELGRRALVDALRRAKVLDRSKPDGDFVPLMADAACAIRAPEGPTPESLRPARPAPATERTAPSL